MKKNYKGKYEYCYIDKKGYRVSGSLFMLKKSENRQSLFQTGIGRKYRLFRFFYTDAEGGALKFSDEPVHNSGAVGAYLCAQRKAAGAGNNLGHHLVSHWFSLLAFIKNLAFTTEKLQALTDVPESAKAGKSLCFCFTFGVSAADTA